MARLNLNTGTTPPSDIRHGWCYNDQNHGLIWMPLLQRIYTGNQDSRNLLQQWEQLAFTLKKIAKYRRLCLEDSIKHGQHQNQSDFSEAIEARFLLPGTTEYAFTLCKRIIQNTLITLENNKFIQNLDPSRTKPIDDPIGLQKLITKNQVALICGNLQKFCKAWSSYETHDWICELWNKERIDMQKMGMRNLLVHHNIVLQVNCGADGEKGFCDLSVLHPSLTNPPQFIRTQVLEALRKIIHGMCRVYDETFDTLGNQQTNNNTSTEQLIFWNLPGGQRLTSGAGSDVDSTYFWPRFGVGTDKHE